MLSERDYKFNALVERVKKDRVEVDYRGQSIDLRNNPWFFSKNYQTPPLLDDVDFFYLIENFKLYQQKAKPFEKFMPPQVQALPKKLPIQY